MKEPEQAQIISVIRRKHDAQQTRYDRSKSRVSLVAHEHRRVLIEIVDSQAQKIESMEETLHRIAEWCKAYPIEVFPEPDFNVANNLLKQGGMSADAIAASMARHIMSKLQELLK